MTDSPERPQPLQPIVMVDKVIRFQPNAVVKFIVDQLVGAYEHGKIVSKDGTNYSFNALMSMPWSDEDRDQFNQLHGYSVSGLPWRSQQRQAQADRIAAKLTTSRPIDLSEPINHPCQRWQCSARVGEPCKELPSGDGRKDYDQELVIGGFHQARLQSARVGELEEVPDDLLADMVTDAERACSSVVVVINRLEQRRREMVSAFRELQTLRKDRNSEGV